MSSVIFPATYICGMGVVSSIGTGISEFSAALRASHDCFGTHVLCSAEENNGCELSYIASRLTEHDFTHVLEQAVQGDSQLFEKCLHASKRYPVSVLATLNSVVEAWIDARLHNNKIPPERIGLVVSADSALQRFLQDIHVSHSKMLDFVPPSSVVRALPSDYVGLISEIFGIKGEGFVVSGASAGGNVALIKAHQMIKLGIADACLVVGSMSELSSIALQGFRSSGAMGGKSILDPHKACRPFDKLAEGFLYGESAACLILESEASLFRRGENPKAALLGGCLVLDANRSTDPGLDGESRAINGCLEDAKVSLDEVDYINTHGTSSPKGDEIELAAIRQVFGKKSEHIWINSTKSLTGHCLFSAGVVEAVSVVLQLEHNFLHTNKNLEDPLDRDLKFVQALTTDVSCHRALSNSFGFGGINSSVLIGRVDVRLSP